MFLIDFTKHLSITSTEFESWRTLNTNAKCLAETLFTTYFYAFILSGYILLLAMFGSICLTLKQKFNSKSQKVFNQVLADFNETIKY
jgi:NADH:ubiquinone oxidoreductase subunit 6 (subunit J)